MNNNYSVSDIRGAGGRTVCGGGGVGIELVAGIDTTALVSTVTYDVFAKYARGSLCGPRHKGARLGPRDRCFSFTAATRMTFSIGCKGVTKNTLVRIFARSPVACRAGGLCSVGNRTIFGVFTSTSKHFANGMRLPGTARGMCVVSRD